MDNISKLELLADELSEENEAKIFFVELNEFDDEVCVQFTFYCPTFSYISMKNIDDSFSNYCIGFFSREYYLNDEKLLPLDPIETENPQLLNAYVKSLYFKKY
ncbi:hypothetical protein [Enterococcus sp. HY326]|uniref:hypothetical protein n=1 Tax=Enterococcus sp. HY326 TaxID=2971265 RepID=UPI00223EABED|nr:hypothetical protein [Enterococcus sp. HY326]